MTGPSRSFPMNSSHMVFHVVDSTEDPLALVVRAWNTWLVLNATSQRNLSDKTKETGVPLIHAGLYLCVTRIHPPWIGDTRGGKKKVWCDADNACADHNLWRSELERCNSGMHNASSSHLGEGSQNCASLLDSETSNESRTIPRRRLGAGSAMEHLANSARLNRAKKVQQAGHTGFWQRHWGWGMAKTHIEQVLRRRGENSGTVSESWLDVG